MSTIIIVDPDRFILKNKPVSYIGPLIELYKEKNRGQVHDIHGIIKLESMSVLITKNPNNLSTHPIIEIFLILYSVYIVFKDLNKLIFYVNNYID